jgi:large subunit ribosomal protein L3
MWRGILGKKIGMTQFFTEDGRRVGVTVVQAGPCPVLQLKTKENDGYDAYQIGFGDKREKVSTKPEIGHAKKAGAAPQRFVREIRLAKPQAGLEVGTSMTIAAWEDVKVVQVTSKSKGKGFQGVIKRHNFHGLRATHGVKTHHRHPGSSGSLTPARVVLGHKGPGHMGDAWVTQKGLKVAKLIPEKNLILLEGSVPGGAGGFVILRPAQPYQPPV